MKSKSRPYVPIRELQATGSIFYDNVYVIFYTRDTGHTTAKFYDRKTDREFMVAGFYFTTIEAFENDYFEDIHPDDLRDDDPLPFFNELVNEMHIEGNELETIQDQFELTCTTIERKPTEARQPEPTQAPDDLNLFQTQFELKF